MSNAVAPTTNTSASDLTPSPDATVVLSDILKRDAIASRAEMHSWEQQLVKTWEEVPEDEQGRLLVDGGLDGAYARKRALEAEYLRTRGARDAVVQKGLIRNLVIVIDLSAASAIKEDKRFSRKQLLFEALDSFIDDYFAQNPVSQLCLIAAGTRAQKVTLLSGSPSEQKRRIRAFDSRNESFSLQNALTVAAATLSHVPPHGSREVLVAMSALGTTDPGDIDTTTLLLQRERVRVSFLMFSAEVFVAKQIALRTGGQFIVAQNPVHMRESIMSFVAPPLITNNSPSSGGDPALTASSASAEEQRRFERRWVKVGFPNRESAVNAGSSGSGGSNTNTAVVPHTTQSQGPGEMFCSCHFNPVSEGYRCPRCSALVCELPTVCCSCGIALVASPQLARSYHHLFPVPSFAILEVPSEVGSNDNDSTVKTQNVEDGNSSTELPGIVGESTIGKWNGTMTTPSTTTSTITNAAPIKSVLPSNLQYRCFGCKVHINTQKELVVVCPECELPFCFDCDQLVHLSLHNCPGCLSSSEAVKAVRLTVNNKEGPAVKKAKAEVASALQEV